MSHHLQVPVLQHASLKPSYACIKGIRAYFASLPGIKHFSSNDSKESSRRPMSSELIVVGDRVFTDVVLANRMRSSSSSSHPPAADTGPGTLAIWTTGVWKKESMLMRCCEKQLVEAVQKWSTPPPSHPDTSGFIKRSRSEEAHSDTKETSTGTRAGGISGWLCGRLRLRRT